MRPARLLGGRLRRRLFDDDVGVGAAHPERGDRRRGVGGRWRVHGAGSVSSRTLPVVQSTLRAGLGDVQGAGELVVVHGEDHLDDPADAGRRLGVADVGLQRAEPERVSGAGRRWRGVACASIGSPSAVPVPCASTASTSVGVSPALRQRLADHPLLRRPVRCGQAVGRAVLVDRGTTQQGQDRVAVAAARRTAVPRPARRRPRPRPCRRPRRRTPCNARPWRARAAGRTRRTAPGVAITVTPPARASEHSPDRKACAARCNATSDDEHAVSTVIAGPSRPSA